MRSDTTYLFIDGGYLRKLYDDTVNKWFKGKGVLDLRSLRGEIDGPNPMPQKAFFYDCKDELKKKAETKDELAARVATQESYFDSIRELEGFHVRLGQLVGGTQRRRRQKEVDVLLAVDMMNHAARQNMARAVLVTGDRDFRPLVDSLIQLGVYVVVACEKRSGSSELMSSADHRLGLDFERLYHWTTEATRKNYPWPKEIQAGWRPDGLKMQTMREVESSSAGAGELRIFEGDREFFLVFDGIGVRRRLCYGHHDVEPLLLFFELRHGPVKWAKGKK